MNILHITCSPRADESHSTRLSYKIVARLVAGRPQPTEVTLRDLAWAPLPHADGAYARALAGAVGPADPHHDWQEGQRASQPASRQGGQTEAPADSLARSDALIAELEAADAVVIGTPMHNYTIPSNLKAWMDHVLRIGRTFAPSPEGKRGLLRDRPVYIAVAAGGFYTGGRARQPDFLTPYLQAALGTMGLHTLHFVPLQGMVLGSDHVAQAWSEADATLQALLPAGAPGGATSCTPGTAPGNAATRAVAA